jgi:hypothetical protein
MPDLHLVLGGPFASDHGRSPAIKNLRQNPLCRGSPAELSLPHMNTLVAATGTGAMLDRWVEFVRTRMIASVVVNLDLHTPDAVRGSGSPSRTTFLGMA